MASTLIQIRANISEDGMVLLFFDETGTQPTQTYGYPSGQNFNDLSATLKLFDSQGNQVGTTQTQSVDGEPLSDYEYGASNFSLSQFTDGVYYLEYQVTDSALSITYPLKKYGIVVLIGIKHDLIEVAHKALYAGCEECKERSLEVLRKVDQRMFAMESLLAAGDYANAALHFTRAGLILTNENCSC